MGCFSCECSPIFLSNIKKGNNNKKRHSPKGACKSGMMATIKPGSDLPGLQALVANYAKMLYEEQSQFIDTLFRAVKLNKVDVVKILCKIVSKSGMKLSSHDMREQESSASILHVALLYNHADMIDFLLSLQDPDLILAKYETDEYHNQTGLHVAVSNGDVKVIEKLLLALQGQERQVLINTLADGHYFKTRHPHGQLCLTAAAWAGHFDVIKCLVKYGGNLALKNSMGNTVLHSVVLQSAVHPERTDYEKLFQTIWEAAYVKAETLHYDSKSKEHRKFQQRQMQVNIFKQLLAIRNQDGYTPLALATTAMSPLLEPMLNLEKIYKIPQNKLGSIAWVTYDVSDITSFAHQKYNKFSMLHILAHNGQLLSRGADPNRNNDTDAFELEPVRTILENKWGVYRWVYIGWCLMHIAYMILFTAVTIEANSSPLFTKGKVSKNHSFDVQWWLIVFTIMPAAYIILEILDLFGNRPFRIQHMSNQNMALRLIKCLRSEWTIIGNGPYRMVGMGFSCFTLQWFLLYSSKDSNQDIALAMSLLLGWIFVLFFTRGCRVTCRFSIMIQNLFLSDLIYFLTVYSIVLIGFSFAMNAMFTYMGDADMAISKVFYDMMNVVTDLDQKQSTEESRHPLFTKLLLIVYAIVAVILLLNMLIAMMNTSYEIVTVTRCNLWKQQQLSIMLMIERRFFWLKWLPMKSEQDIRTEGDDDDLHHFLDVTMLHSGKFKT